MDLENCDHILHLNSIFLEAKTGERVRNQVVNVPNSGHVGTKFSGTRGQQS